MAYLDLSNVFAQSAALAVSPPADFIPAPVEAASFARTEWAVIAMARTDGLASLRAARPSKLRRLLFGQPRVYTLTGERLEALRRLAVEAWRQPQSLSLPALGAFISVGFSSAQLALLLSTTGAMPVMAKLISASLQKFMPNAASGNTA